MIYSKFNPNYIVLIFSFFLLTSCKQDDLPTAPVEEINPLVVISGTIYKWNGGDSMNVLLVPNSGLATEDVYSSAPVNSDGDFSLTHLMEPKLSLFQNPVYPRFIEGVHFTSNSIVCSDSTAQFIEGVLRFALLTDTLKHDRGGTWRSSREYYYRFYERFLYVNKDVSVKGKANYFFADTNAKRHTFVDYAFDLRYKKGWNREIQATLSENSSIDTLTGYTLVNIVVQSSNYKPPDTRWDFLLTPRYYEINIRKYILPDIQLGLAPNQRLKLTE